MNSRVHPTYKTKYRVSNWPEYDQALVRRGDLTPVPCRIQPRSDSIRNAGLQGPSGGSRRVP